MHLEELRGAQIVSRLNELAKLRTIVFRDWPYLYEGSLDYERQYLDMYVRSSRSLAVLAWDDDLCVGATTVLPLRDAEPHIQQPFLERNLAVDDIAYFGESVVLEQYRNKGLGTRFFELRETYARKLGLTLCTFCSVDRPVDHPARPHGRANPNDAFWKRRRYRKNETLQAQLQWQDVGSSEPTPKRMTFWYRALGPQ